MFEGTIFEQPPRSDPSVARVASSTQQMSLEVRQLSEQMDALNRSVEVMDGRLNRLEAQAAAASGSRGSDELVALRRDIQMLRAEREALRKEITEDLAARVERIAARQQAEYQASKAAAAPVSRPAAPAASAAGAAARSGYEHVVEKGQTLSEIARGYGKSLDAIMKANKIANPSSIRVGQKLFIPD
jgi:nucleoid-associated protein YgaU